MPTKKNRGTEGRNGKVFSLKSAMHVPGTKPGYGTPGKIETVTKSIKEGGSRSGAKVSAASHEGYDVKTRVNVPTAKGMGKAGRSQRKMKAK